MAINPLLALSGLNKMFSGGGGQTPKGFGTFSSIAQPGLDLYGAYSGMKIAGYQADLQRALGGIQAKSLEKQAVRAETVGRRAYEAEQYKGRVAISDATAAMAAGGGGVSARQLAKLKARADMNAISALYDATSRAADLRTEAGMTRAGARAEAYQTEAEGRYGFQKAFTTAMGDWAKVAKTAQRPSWFKGRGKGAPVEERGVPVGTYGPVGPYRTARR